MNKYLVESTHTEEDCLRILDEFVAIGHVTNFDWGCMDDVHKGWAIVDAESPQEALLCVPAIVRDKATVVKLVKFTPEEIERLHNQSGM